jgi:hypothetical protein
MCELLDFRVKITEETDAWLDSCAAATGEDRQTIARNILHKLALAEIDEAIVKYERLLSKGMVRAR